MQSGETVGHYRVLHTLGKGGMGEVYAADDTKLHRRVALKILPAVFATDPSFLERFQREAQAVAALNHPNIVTIYSVEEDGTRPFITMELVDGRPLSEAIGHRGLPLDRILRIGIDVADAMAAAQQRGITHRDLKPANIMIAADGRAKVLDFGLAKVRDAELAMAGEQVTRMSRELTGEGKILGTVAYMSPEQAEGKPVDPRSDIFSLGVVLHEMATGERPFKGDTNVSIISSIIKDTPKPITEANPGLPADLARIVRRCLAKDPSRRYQTAADVRNELDELKQDSDAGAMRAAPRRQRQTSRIRVAWIGAAIGGLVVATAAMLLVSRERHGFAPSAGFAIDRIQRLTTTGTASNAAISADGRYVVHVKMTNGLWALWTRQTVASSDVEIVPPAAVGYRGIVLSADGNYVYYNAYAGGSGVASLFKLPVLGGTPTPILNDVDSAIAFSPDQKHFAFMRGKPSRGITELVIADSDGGNAHPLVTSSSPRQFQLRNGPSWSPDGKTILATVSQMFRGQAWIEAVDAVNGTTQTIGGPWGQLRDVAWLRDGRSFLVTGLDDSTSSAQIWWVSYPAGERHRVTADLNVYQGLSVSSDGRIIATVQSEVEAGIFAAQGADREPRRLTNAAGRADGTFGIAWMPDGRLVYSSTASGLTQLWIVDSDGDHARPLTSQSTYAITPLTSPDGAWVYFASQENGAGGIFRIKPDGTGVQRIALGGVAFLTALSPDGKTIYFTSLSDMPRLMRMSTSGGEAAAVSNGWFRASDVTPDGTHACGGRMTSRTSVCSRRFWTSEQARLTFGLTGR